MILSRGKHFQIRFSPANSATIKRAKIFRGPVFSRFGSFGVNLDFSTDPTPTILTEAVKNGSADRQDALLFINDKVQAIADDDEGGASKSKKRLCGRVAVNITNVCCEYIISGGCIACRHVICDAWYADKH